MRTVIKSALRSFGKESFTPDLEGTLVLSQLGISLSLLLLNLRFLEAYTWLKDVF
jgi:hypothetical protein